MLNPVAISVPALVPTPPKLNNASLIPVGPLIKPLKPIKAKPNPLKNSTTLAPPSKATTPHPIPL